MPVLRRSIFDPIRAWKYPKLGREVSWFSLLDSFEYLTTTPTVVVLDWVLWSSHGLKSIRQLITEQWKNYISFNLAINLCGQMVLG
jgi:hypothetical protein